MKLMTEGDFVAKKLKYIQEMNGVLTKLICEKYQDQSLKLYDKILSNNVHFMYFGDLVESLAASDLPKAAKVELLARGVRSRQIHQSYRALNALLEQDESAFSSACLDSLGKLAWDGDGGQADRVRTNIVSLAFRTEDRKVRETAEKYVKRLPANPKLAVLKQLQFRTDFGRARLETLSFLCQFLDGSSTYRDPMGEKKGFKNLDLHITEMEVRKFAAMQILKNICVDKMVTIETSEEEWEKSGNSPRMKSSDD